MQVLNRRAKETRSITLINSLRSEATKEKYKFCLEKFLSNHKLDLSTFLKLPQQDITNLIIKYLVNKKVSSQYKNLISATLKHACEINDIYSTGAK